MASFASSATTGGARKHAWTNYFTQELWELNLTTGGLGHGFAFIYVFKQLKVFLQVFFW